MIECRGRNGWFNLHEATAFHFLNNTKPPEEGTVAVEIRSKKMYRDISPIYFQGPKAEVESLLMDLLEKVRATS